MPNPSPLHPVEQPALRALMLLSFFLGVLLLFVNGPPTNRFVGVLTMLSFAVFLLALGLLLLAWMLREHELWREGRQDQED